jgi:chromate transporter
VKAPERQEPLKQVSLWYLARSFLLVGSTSFGGYASLVAIVRNVMVERDGVLDDETIMKGFSLASILPGPVAVNTVAYLGYRLRGWPGGLVSFFMVLAPPVALIMVLSHFYDQAVDIVYFDNFLAGVFPVVAAVILSTAYNMGKKSLKNFTEIVIFLVVLLVNFFFQGIWVYLGSFLFGAITGFFLLKQEGFEPQPKMNFRATWQQVTALVTLALVLVFSFVEFNLSNVLLNLFKAFSGVSLTLFGGGYVMIPALQEIVVAKYAWLNQKEFIDSITLGQITPGPILISATFIGYKVSGIIGALVSTIGIFTPSALLIITISDSLRNLEKNKTWIAINNGLKPVVTGLIVYSVYIVLSTATNWWFALPAFIVAVLLVLRYKVNIFALMIISGLAGIFFI